MPTILHIKGLRFYFFSDDHRPIHIHVQRGRNGPKAKIELEPKIKIISVSGFSQNDMRKILNLCKQAKEDFIEAWEEFFDDK